MIEGGMVWRFKTDSRPIRDRFETGNREGEERIEGWRSENFSVNFFFHFSRWGSENTRNSEKISASVLRSAFRSSGASPRCDATRCDTMRSIIEIDHAKGGVGGGRRGDWSREITLMINIHFTRGSVRDFDFLLGLPWFQVSSIFFFPSEFATDLLHFRFESIVLTPFTSRYTLFFTSFFLLAFYRLPFFVRFFLKTRAFALGIFQNVVSRNVL